jgi:hypothetical protein
LNGHRYFGPQAKGARNRILAARGRLVQFGDFGAPMSAQAIASEDAVWSKNPQFVPLPKGVLPEVRQNRQTRDEELFAKSQPAKAFRDALTSRYRRLKISAVFSGRRWLGAKNAKPYRARLVITNRAAITKYCTSDYRFGVTKSWRFTVTAKKDMRGFCRHGRDAALRWSAAASEIQKHQMLPNAGTIRTPRFSTSPK